MKICKNIWLALILLIISSRVLAYEVTYFKNDKLGIFKVSLSSQDLKISNSGSMTLELKSDKLFAVYIYDSRMELQTDRGRSRSFSSEEQNKIQKIYEEIAELNKKKQKIEEENKFAKMLLEKAQRGEDKLSPETIVKYEKQVKSAVQRTKDINDKINAKQSEQTNFYRKASPYNDRSRESAKKIVEQEVNYVIYGRYLGAGEAGLAVNSIEDEKKLLTITLSLPQEYGGNQQLLGEWLQAQKQGLNRLRNSTPGESVFQYIEQQSVKMWGSTETVTTSASRSFEPRPQVDLYSVTTGALAIQESLQIDRMTIGANQKVQTNEPLETIKGPTIKSLPFTEMLKGREPVILPMDAVVPADFYYLHFSDINKEIEFSDLLDQWGTSLLNVMQVASHNAEIKEKYLKQLCLQTSILTRLFGDKVIEDLAIVGNDPFLHEGTDLSVIIRVKAKETFENQVQQYLDDAKAKWDDLVETDINYNQIDIRAAVTPDQEIASYNCYLGDYKVYSNSLDAIKKIIDTYQKNGPSMAEEDDYLYMRSVFLADRKSEDAFLYLSEKFITKMVGPRWKIARQRRITCNNTLRMMNNSISFYYAEGNKEIPSLEKLITGRFLERTYLYCQDGGEYSIDTKGLPLCSKHGQLRYLTPINELLPEKASAKEKQDYERFVTEYNRYWSKYFDPIGIRIKLDNQTIKVDTCILPLVENTVYNSFKDFAVNNAGPVDFNAVPGTILRMLTKVNWQDKGLDNFKTQLLQKTSFTASQFEKTFGESVVLGFTDGDPLFSADLSKGGRFLGGFRGSGVEFLAGNFLLSAITLPAYIGIPVKDEPQAARFIHELLVGFTRQNQANSPMGLEWLKVSNYQESPDYKGFKIETLDLDLFILKIRLHFMVYNKQLFITTKRNILLGLIDKQPQLEKADTNLQLTMIPAAYNQVADTYKMDWQSRIRTVCNNNLGCLYALKKYRKIAVSELDNVSLAVNGFFPYCPANGKYIYSQNRDQFICTVHGDYYISKQPHELDLSVPLNKFFNSIKRIDSSLKFIPEGIMTSITLERAKE